MLEKDDCYKKDLLEGSELLDLFLSFLWKANQNLVALARLFHNVSYVKFRRVGRKEIVLWQYLRGILTYYNLKWTNLTKKPDPASVIVGFLARC